MAGRCATLMPNVERRSPARSMAPGPNLCRFERICAERQTWRVGTRGPGRTTPGAAACKGFSLQGGPGATAAPFEPAEVDRFVEVDVVERPAEQLDGVAGQRIRVLR